MKSGCHVCGCIKELVEFNDLVTTHSFIAEEEDGWNPRTITQGSGKKLIWECCLGHKWIAPVPRYL